MILEDRGYFWWSDEPVPDHRFAPDAAIPGYLTIADDGAITLELDGFLAGVKETVLAFLHNDNTRAHSKPIQGLLKGGTHVLLLGWTRIGATPRQTKISSERYFATTCLAADDAFSISMKALKFFKIEINLRGFEDWLQIASIQLSRRQNSISTTYRRPKELVYRVGVDKLSIRFDISAPILSGILLTRSVSLEETTALVYAFRKSVTLTEVQSFYDLIQDLFVLLTGSEYRMEWPVLYVGQKRQKCRLYFYSLTSSATPPSIDELWTRFPQLHPSFSAIFSLWVRKRTNFGAGYYLYLGTRRGMRSR